MGTSYTRQSASAIVTGNTIEAADLNAEFNQIESFANGTTGHSHDGTTGEGPKINLTTSVTGILPVANGGTGGSSASAARTALGLAIGTDVQAYDAQLADVAGLTPTDGNFIVGDGYNFVAESGATARTSLGLGTIATQSASSVTLTGGTINGIIIGGTTASAGTFTNISLEDATNQIVLDSNGTYSGTISLATLSGDVTYTFPDETGTVVTTARTSSDSQAGIVELATASEVDTGTDTARAITPGGFSDSIYGKIPVTFPSATSVKTATGDGWSYFHVPSALNGMDLVSVEAFVATAGTTGTTDIQVHNVSGAVDILSTKLTIDSGETNSSTAATPAVINTSNDNVSTGDILRIDIDAVSTTPAEGLVVILYFRIP
jgi:hypothetical protein